MLHHRVGSEKGPAATDAAPGARGGGGPMCSPPSRAPLMGHAAPLPQAPHSASEGDRSPIRTSAHLRGPSGRAGSCSCSWHTLGSYWDHTVRGNRGSSGNRVDTAPNCVGPVIGELGNPSPNLYVEVLIPSSSAHDPIGNRVLQM